jgi:hypothetical protein
VNVRGTWEHLRCSRTHAPHAVPDGSLSTVLLSTLRFFALGCSPSLSKCSAALSIVA